MPAPQGADPDLYGFFSDLPDKLRLPMVLHYLEGYDVRRIAGILRIPAGTVKSRLSRGRAAVPAGSVSVKDKAARTGADILCVQALANGLVDAEGEFHPATVGFDGIVQEDGSIVFYTEIDLEYPIPRQEEYTISLYLSNRQVTPEGEHLMDTRISEDWVFTIAPDKAE